MRIGLPYKRPKAIVQANAKTQLDYQPTFHTERKTVAGIIWRGARGDQDEPGSHTTTTPTQLQGIGEQKGNCSHMPPETSMADITAHALPSRDGEKMKIDHPTNDPRPSFRQNRNTTLLPTHLSRETKGQGRAGESLTYASRDEHGRHYRSCATEQGWREDENRSPYKRPKAIVQAKLKHNSITNPPFTRNEGTRESRANEPHERAQSQPRVTT